MVAVPQSQFEFVRAHVGDIPVAMPIGEIDLTTAPELIKGLAAQFTAGTAAVVVRLDRVTFIDSTGLNALVVAHRRARERGVHFTLAAPSGAVRRVLDMTGLDRAIPTHATLRTALADARKLTGTATRRAS